VSGYIYLLIYTSVCICAILSFLFIIPFSQHFLCLLRPENSRICPLIWIRPSICLLKRSNRLMNRTLVSPLVLEAIVHLEEAARSGHVFAMFNLGISHLYGYGRTDGRRDPDLAAEWFEASGLPEGLFAKSLHASSVGRKEEAEMWRSRASLLGFGSSWRKHARERTGSGGSSGAKLNLKWPPLPTGETPQEF
jgi:hypothetical protein